MAKTKTSGFNYFYLFLDVSGSIRQLSKTTSILTDPTKLPEECYKAAISKP